MLLRAVGDSLVTLYFLIIAAILNILLIFICTAPPGGQSATSSATIVRKDFCTSLFLYIRQKNCASSCRITTILFGIKTYQDLIGEILWGSCLLLSLSNSYLTISYQQSLELTIISAQSRVGSCPCPLLPLGCYF